MANIGYATLTIIPSFRGGHQAIMGQLSQAGSQAGAKAGADAGNAFTRGLRSGVDAAAKVVATGMTAAAAAGVAALATGWQRMTTIQDSAAALTISLGDSAAAASLLGDVLDTVRGTPFNLDEFAQAAQQMVGMGIEAQKVPGYLEAIGEAAATQGGRASEMAGRLTTVFGQMAASGQVQLTDIWRVSDTGVNALAILGNHFGVTTDAMKKMVSDGAVPAAEALDALAKGIVEGSDGPAGATIALAGTMEALRETVSGAVGGIRPALARLGAAFLEPFSPQIVAGANGLTDTIDRLTDRVGEFASRLARSDSFARFSEFMGELPDIADAALDSMDRFGPALAGVTAGLGALGAAQLPIPLFGQLAKAVNPVAAGLIGVALASPEARAALADMAAEIAPLVRELVEALLPAVEALVVSSGSLLPTAIGLATTALSALLQIVTPMVEVLAGHPEIVYAAAGAYLAWQASIAGAAVWSAASAGITSVSAAFKALQGVAATRGISTAAAGMGALRSSIAGAASAAGPAGIAVAGLGVALGYGFYAKTQAARQALERATESVAKFTDSLNIDDTDINSISRAMDALASKQREVAESAPTGAFAATTWAREWSHEYELLGDEMDDLASKQFALSTTSWITAAGISASLQLPIDRVRELADAWDIDLSAPGAFDEFTREAQRLGEVAAVTGHEVTDLMALGEDQQAAWSDAADAMDEASKAVSGLWDSFFDLTQLTHDPVDPKAIEDAIKAVEDAERDLERARSGAARNERDRNEAVLDAERALADARKKRADAEDAADRSTAAKAIEDAERALRDAREAREDARTSGADDEAAAIDRVREAEERLADVRASDSPLDRGAILAFYEERIADAEEFGANLQTAIAAGYDPALIARIMAEGPEAAGDLLTTLAANTDAAFVDMVNEGERRMAEFSAAAVRQAQLTAAAIAMATDDRFTADDARDAAELLGLSVAVEMEWMRGGKVLTAEQLATRMGLDLEDVRRGIQVFQLDIPVELDIDEATRQASEFAATDRILNYVAIATLAAAEQDLTGFERQEFVAEIVAEAVMDDAQLAIDGVVDADYLATIVALAQTSGASDDLDDLEGQLRIAEFIADVTNAETTEDVLKVLARERRVKLLLDPDTSFMARAGALFGGTGTPWWPFADGGPVFGGVPGKDSVPAMLMPGEFVIRKSIVDRLGLGLLTALNGGVLPGFAEGGPVGRTYAAADPYVDAFHQDRRTASPASSRPSAAITVNAVDADDAVRRLMWETAT